MTFYSAFEQHYDGSWWYHLDTFTDRAASEEFLKKWIWWDTDRRKTIFEHEHPLPQETLWTRDFESFFRIADSTPIKL